MLEKWQIAMLAELHNKESPDFKTLTIYIQQIQSNR